MWQRENKLSPTFNDLERLGILGNGTFGKVYLVRCRLTKNLHAMKCIRKDIVIENESIQNLVVEKMI